MSIVSLVSGGIDSLVMAKVIDGMGSKQIPLFINYGQLSTDREWKACKTIFKLADFPKPIRIDVEGYGKFFPSGITDLSKDIEKEAFLPGRNLLFLTIASSFAHMRGLNKVAIGLLSEKYSVFPDQTQEFVVNSNIAINSALGANLTIATPLSEFSKSDVMRLAEEYDLPLEDTYSCHSGSESYCGKCIACKEILKATNAVKLPQFKTRG